LEPHDALIFIPYLLPPLYYARFLDIALIWAIFYLSIVQILSPELQPTSSASKPVIMTTIYTFILLALTFLIPTIRAIPIISVKGTKFFANGQQFFIKGTQSHHVIPLHHKLQLTSHQASPTKAPPPTPSLMYPNATPTQPSCPP